MTLSDHALAAARSIANYCSTRFPTDAPPWDLLDVPWFAEQVQRAIDAALAAKEDLGRYRCGCPVRRSDRVQAFCATHYRGLEDGHERVLQ